MLGGILSLYIFSYVFSCAIFGLVCGSRVYLCFYFKFDEGRLGALMIYFMQPQVFILFVQCADQSSEPNEKNATKKGVIYF